MRTVNAVAKQAANKEDSAARRKSNRDEEIKWANGESDDSMFKTPASNAFSTLSGDSDADDAVDIAQYRLPAIGRIKEMSLVTISDTTNIISKYLLLLMLQYSSS